MKAPNMQQIRGATIHGPIISDEGITNLRNAPQESNDDTGKFPASKGLHERFQVPSSATQSHLGQGKGRSRMARRRSSEPAVKDQDTYYPSPAQSHRKRRTAKKQQSPDEVPLFRKSLSSSSLRGMDYEPQHTHWSSDTVRHKSTEKLINSANGSSSTISTSKYSFGHNNNTSSTRSSSRSSTSSLEFKDFEADGFGQIVRPPSTVMPGSPKPHSGMTTTFTKAGSRRRLRNAEPTSRLSQNDFQPVDPMFGDFAPPGTPATNTDFHRSLPPSAFRNPLGYFDSESEGDLSVDMLTIVRPTTRRLWDSMPQILSEDADDMALEQNIEDLEFSKEGQETGFLNKDDDSNSTDRMRNDASPKNVQKRIKFIRRMSASDLAESKHKQATDSLDASVSNLAQDKSSDAMKSLEHTLSRPPNHVIEPPTVESLFLIEMENFRTKNAYKKESKERAKLKKEESRRKKHKRKSVQGEPTIEFNVEDQSGLFGLDTESDYDDEGDYDDEATDVFESQTKSQPFEIEWTPPAFVLKEDARPEHGPRITRRFSMPASLNEYEPITPTFVYDKSRRRKPPKGGDESSITDPPPFLLDGGTSTKLKETASAVDSILKLEAGVTGEFSAIDLGYNQDFNEPTERNRSQTRMSTSLSSRGKTSRRRSGRHSIGHRAETPPRTKKGPSTRLDRSCKSKTESGHSSGRKREGKARRRGSTSALEMKSSPGQVTGRSRRREGSLPPRSSREGEKSSSRKKSKSPAAGSRFEKSASTLDTSSSNTRSKVKSSKSGKREGTSEMKQSSSSRRDKPGHNKKSSSRRMSTRGSPVSRSKSPKESRQHSHQDAASHGLHLTRTECKSGPRPSRYKGRSSLPASSSIPADRPEGNEKRKTRTKTSRRQTEEHSLSQSQPIDTNLAGGLKKKSVKRSKSFDRSRKDRLHASLKSSHTKSKSPKDKTKRRATLNHTNSRTALDSHIVPPRLQPSSQGSMSGMTFSTAKSDDLGTNRYRPALPKRTSSWSAEFDLG